MDENKDIKSTSLGYLEERELGNNIFKFIILKFIQKTNTYRKKQDLGLRTSIKRKADLSYKKSLCKIFIE